MNHPKQLKLIFRASQHNFSAKAFHLHCDKYQDTLLLVRTNYGRTLGGYSHYKWMNDEKMIKEGMDRNTVIDEKRRTFLLQVDEQHKLIPQSDDALISCA